MKLLLVLLCLNMEPDKRSVLTILEQKCNSCHRVANPDRVFSLINMDANAGKIYKQVFQKKRMPLAGANPLTGEELALLKVWTAEALGKR